jgi:hypothetical protein
VRRSGWALAVLGLLVAASLRAQVAAAPPTPGATRPAGSAKPAKAPKPRLDFTGVWQLDEKASKNVSKHMEGALLSVKQNGNKIWIEPSAEGRAKIMADEIVVDGRPYEKAVGKQKATVVADWGKDGDPSLWIDTTVASDDNPNAVVKRTIWRLYDFGNTWTRQTGTINGEEKSGSFLVFRKKGATLAPSPTPKRKP